MTTRPVLVGPVTYLLLGKEPRSGSARAGAADGLLPVYPEVLAALAGAGAEWVQIDEPFWPSTGPRASRPAAGLAARAYADRLRPARS